MSETKTQAQMIENLIELEMLKGHRDLNDIYSTVVHRLGLPRPTVRRVAGEYRRRLESYCKILNFNCELHEKILA